MPSIANAAQGGSMTQPPYKIDPPNNKNDPGRIPEPRIGAQPP
jgi:hypothetical protein